jgi:hypothetical protein
LVTPGLKDNVTHGRFIIHYHIGVRLEDYRDFVGEFGTTLGFKSVEKED